MPQSLAAPAVTEHDRVPARLRALSPLRPDYGDAFSVFGADVGEHSPERWATAIGETAGLGGQFVWRVLCGLRLDTTSNPATAGWSVGGRGDDWVRLEASSWFMTPHLVIAVDPTRLSVATLIRYDHPAGRIIWPPIAAFHRRALPGLLAGATRAVRRASS